jgi:hypothetical protein
MYTLKQMANPDIIPEEDVIDNPLPLPADGVPKYRYKILFEDCNGYMLSTYDATWENAAITAEILDQTEIFFVRRIVRVSMVSVPFKSGAIPV